MEKQITDVVKEYLNKPYIEVELRLGKFNFNMFDTNVGKDVFDKVHRRLTRYSQWENIVTSEDEVFYWDNARLVYNDSNDTSTCVKKNKIMKKDFKCSPLDVRLGISQEVPTEQPETDAKRKVSRYRTSFIRKNLSIDLTIVHGAQADIDSEETVVYQIELEILNPGIVKSDDELYNIIYKVNDLLKICE